MHFPESPQIEACHVPSWIQWKAHKDIYFLSKMFSQSDDVMFTSPYFAIIPKCEVNEESDKVASSDIVRKIKASEHE